MNLSPTPPFSLSVTLFSLFLSPLPSLAVALFPSQIGYWIKPLAAMKGGRNNGGLDGWSARIRTRSLCVHECYQSCRFLT